MALRLLSTVSVLCLLAISADAAAPLSPRVEVGVKGGTDRSLLTTEFWAPLAQKSDRVLYGDIRLMGDNDENREGNLGIGYRQVHDNAVLGAHGWIDRRRTQSNSTFHQLTFGVERLGHIVDARANVYVPLNQNRTITTPNIGSTTPYLAGTGIFYDTNGFISETPQYGLDGEVGYRLPILQQHADAIRVYGGGYHFFRDETHDVTGFRVRTEAQINSAFSVGARFQHDDPRGSQGFLEATIKFPFGAKKLYQTDYLRARLDESPERDVDIVTAARQLDSGLGKPVINQNSGEAQRILYVDNTNSNAGDGSKENPFNTLKAAEYALRDNDILYVNHGTGTTTGMDQGVVIDRANVQLIGSGSALTYNGFTLLDAGLAPVITNGAVPVDANDLLTGNGVLVTADNAYIAGITVTDTKHTGIRALADGKNFNSFVVTNVTANNNDSSGIVAYTANGGWIETIRMENNTANNNRNVIGSGNGVGYSSRVSGLGNGAGLGTLIISGNNTTGNASSGVVVSNNAATLENLVINNNTISGNTLLGINLSNVSAIMGDVQIDNNTVTGNTGNGIGVSAATSSSVNRLLINGNTISGNAIALSLTANTQANINEIQVNQNTVSGNSSGIYTISNNTAQIASLSFSGNTTTGNTNYGLYATTANNGRIIDTVAENNVTTSNGSYGIHFYATGGTMNTIRATGNTAIGNSNVGIRVNANLAAGLIDHATIENNISNNNTSLGIYGFASAGGAINRMTITGNETNGNTGVNGTGIRLSSDNAGSVVKDVTITDNTANGNDIAGIHLHSNNGSFTNATVSGNTTNNNTANGLLFHTQTATSVLTGVSVSSNDVIGNGASGVYVRLQTGGGMIDVDLGGGSQGSIGQNRIFGNTTYDVAVERVSNVAMGSNWWNNGGVAPDATKVNLVSTGSANFSTPLATDPRP